MSSIEIAIVMKKYFLSGRREFLKKEEAFRRRLMIKIYKDANTFYWEYLHLRMKKIICFTQLSLQRCERDVERASCLLQPLRSAQQQPSHLPSQPCALRDPQRLLHSKQRE